MSNTAHLVATDVMEAREQWIEVFTRNRADLGPALAAQHAARDAAAYATPRPLTDVIADLREAWTLEQRCAQSLSRAQQQHRILVKVAALAANHRPELAAAEQRLENAEHAQTHAADRFKDTDAHLTGDIRRHREELLARWNAERPAARDAARVVNAGPGPLWLRTTAVSRAQEDLTRWAARWQPILPNMPTRWDDITAYADRSDHTHTLRHAFQNIAERRANAAHPDHDKHRAATDAADTEYSQALTGLRETEQRHDRELSAHGPLGYTDDPAAEIHQLDHRIADTTVQSAAARGIISQLSADPAIATQPPGWLTSEHEQWRADQQAQRDARERPNSPAVRINQPAHASTEWHQLQNHQLYARSTPDRGHGISR